MYLRECGGKGKRAELLLAYMTLYELGKDLTPPDTLPPSAGKLLLHYINLMTVE